MQVGLSDQFLDRDLAHAIEMLLDAVPAALIIPAHASDPFSTSGNGIVGVERLYLRTSNVLVHVCCQQALDIGRQAIIEALAHDDRSAQPLGLGFIAGG